MMNGGRGRGQGSSVQAQSLPVWISKFKSVEYIAKVLMFMSSGILLILPA